MDTIAVADAVRLNAVRKVYGEGANAVTALDGVSLSFQRGSFTAVMGPSGSGKSTFLHCAAGLDRPTSGTVLLDGEDLGGYDETALTKMRRERIGFVFQSFNLLPALTVMQNITLPLKLAGRKANRAQIDEVVHRVGLDSRTGHRPAELSGGQQQRVAIARALVTGPAVVFADEPTGALDTRTAREVLRLMRESVRTLGQTIVMVTHDPVAASYADRVVFLADGRFVGDLYNPTAEVVAERMTRLGAWADEESAYDPQARTATGGAY
ncbi:MULTISPECIES: ABC transporter ATP-binding protein [Streptomyces]|uniref:ABC transporter ATP-binding protein n=1 Tax=Streptomyces TaxID=1883 RepID=UPI00163D2EF0|nr:MULTISPECIES: ABC transporter ATP-binding protein [Streptomyces]MBC2879680.1 ABC transporter ATP-binding protein [Streptomyces sp. TYQ1024]UBI35072.1 ABC transporter ATP-binding protein [Streptomyces mobaraensis]UKW27665.1 ABC transporter ATP-binding protein [Streptomyces sp. TYQ1024]